MARFSRQDALPTEMQGQWVDSEDGATLTIEGGDAVFQGVAIDYDWFDVENDEGALAVNFGVDDPARVDSFVRENLCGLVIDPEGNFHGFNTKFGCSFARKEQMK